MRRKRFQRGSVKPRKRRGKVYWYAQWRENGEPRSKELGLCSKVSMAEAEMALAEILRPVNLAATRRVVVDYTFKKFVDEVYLPVALRRWKNSTSMTEVNRTQVHLVAALAKKGMREITREDLQDLLDRKGKSLSESGVDHLRFRLRAIFALALSEGVVDRNPATTLFTPKKCKPAREKSVLTASEVFRAVQVLDLREKIIFRLAACEGMRPGEILALKVGDVGEDSVQVRRRLYRGDIDTPKTKRSVRRVALTDETAKLLRTWLESARDRDPEAWLFPSENPANPLRRDNAWRRSIQPLLARIGLGWANFQVMRRTFATLSKQAGVDAHTRSAQMGNTVDVNENEYAVSAFEDRLAAVRKLEATVQGNGGLSKSEALQTGNSKKKR